MLKIGDKVKLPRFHIDNAVITSVYPIEGYYGVTGKTAGGFTEYRNSSFPSEEVFSL